MKRMMARPMKAAVVRGGSVALKLSDAAFAAPGQHVQLRQDRGGAPPVRRDFADEPAEAAHQIVDVGLFAGQMQLAKSVDAVPLTLRNMSRAE